MTPDRPTGPATAAARAFMLALEDEDVDREALPRTLAAIEREQKALIYATLPAALDDAIDQMWPKHMEGAGSSGPAGYHEWLMVPDPAAARGALDGASLAAALAAAIEAQLSREPGEEG